MFWIDDETKMIHLSRGDTASFYVDTETDGYVFTDDDRALFTIKNGSGNIVFEEAYGLTDETLGNGTFLVEFHNPDTDALATGTYTWDVRYILGPYYDESGRIINGNQVITPEKPDSMELLAVVGEV
jgi:hypothetical protein